MKHVRIVLLSCKLIFVIKVQLKDLTQPTIY